MCVVCHLLYTIVMGLFLGTAIEEGENWHGETESTTLRVRVFRCLCPPRVIGREVDNSSYSNTSNRALLNPFSCGAGSYGPVSPSSPLKNYSRRVTRGGS